MQEQHHFNQGMRMMLQSLPAVVRVESKIKVPLSHHMMYCVYGSSHIYLDQLEHNLWCDQYQIDCFYFTWNFLIPSLGCIDLGP